MIDWPDDYRKLQETGLLARLTDPDDPLWVGDAEFMPEDEIVSYEPLDYQKVEIVPFAFTGAGDYWAYLPDALPGSDIVLCPHDSDEAEYDTACIRDFIFKRMVEFAGGTSLDGDGYWTPDNAKQAISRVCISFADFLSPEMLAELRSIANTVSLVITPFGPSDHFAKLISESRAKELIEKYAPMKRENTTFQWLDF